MGSFLRECPAHDGVDAEQKGDAPESSMAPDRPASGCHGPASGRCYAFGPQFPLIDGGDVSDTRVLLLGDAASEALGRVLAHPGRVMTRIEDPDQLVAAAAAADIIVIDVVPPPHTLTDICRELRVAPELAEVPLLAITATDEVEERIRLLEAGADDVMIKPIDERELDARVEALDLRRRRVKELRPSTLVATTRRPGRRLIVVFSPKGGVGTTTVAVNLALALAAREPDRVAVVDLTASSGHVAIHLNVRARFTIADLVRDAASLASPEGIRSAYVVRHDSGLHVLCGTTSSASASSISGEDVGHLIEAMLGTFPTVVVDAGSHADERALAALDLADDVVIAVTPDFPTLKSVHAFLESARESGSHMPEPTIIVNELYALQPLTQTDIENALQRKAALRLPYDSLVYLRAANQGTPVFAGAPTSQPARRFDQLAAVLVGEDAPTAAPEPRRRGFSGIFSRS
jgi:pilus assembly protein CpaE